MSKSKTKWTPEPWEAVDGDNGELFIFSNGCEVAEVYAENADNPATAIADRARIVTCVNAMQDIDDPAGLRTENRRLREALEALLAEAGGKRKETKMKLNGQRLTGAENRVKLQAPGGIAVEIIRETGIWRIEGDVPKPRRNAFRHLRDARAFVKCGTLPSEEKKPPTFTYEDPELLDMEAADQDDDEGGA